MDIRIGIIHAVREVELELDDRTDRDELKDRVRSALADESEVLWLVDRRGREVAIPSARIAYIDIGSAASARSIGFGA